MKTTSITIIVLCFLLGACKKDNIDAEADNNGFDIHNPVGYYVYVRSRAADQITAFKPGSILVHHWFKTSPLDKPYQIVDGNMIEASFMKIGFQNGKLVSYQHNGFEYGDIHLIKQPGTNQLAGRTFAGKLYRTGDIVVHQNFFYSFDKEELKVGVGTINGQVQRTEPYQLTGNFAASKTTPNFTENQKTDVEWMVFLNGKIEVSYYDAYANAIYYGTFEELK